MCEVMQAVETAHDTLAEAATAHAKREEASAVDLATHAERALRLALEAQDPPPTVLPLFGVFTLYSWAAVREVAYAASLAPDIAPPGQPTGDSVELRASMEKALEIARREARQAVEGGEQLPCSIPSAP